MKKSAGILLYRYKNSGPEVLLVHPGGPFYVNKDEHTWTIPKGEINDNEDVFKAALREFEEETGIQPDGNFIELRTVKQNGGKQVFSWAVEQDLNADKIESNTFSMEWPPKSGKMKDFPEIDKAEWFDYENAVKKILKGQIPILEDLFEKINPKIK